LLTTVKLIPYLFYTGSYAFDMEKITALFSFYSDYFMNLMPKGMCL
jgi:hypothetical protein